MSTVVSIDALEPNQKLTNPRSKPGSGHTDFITTSKDAPDSPTAYLVEHAPGRLSLAHYHANDQFQIVVRGKGKIGRHDMSAYSVHFARAHTPYGPLLSDEQTGWAFMTLRAHHDPGAQHLPAAQQRLQQVADRRPWQAIEKVTFPTPVSGAQAQQLANFKDDQGLFACVLTMGPGAHMTAPDPSGGNGQFVLVVNGSLTHEGKEHAALAVVFVKNIESAFEIHAGPQGLQGFILNFPAVKPRPTQIASASAKSGFKKWQCVLCSFAYDEARGMPEEGIAPGTRWEDVPDSWTCPDCSAAKNDFEMVEVG